MPATITHAFFAKDVYDILPQDVKKRINPKRIKMFGQGMDSLLFYNLVSFSSGKDIRKFNHYFHRNNTREYFINLLEYAKDNDFTDNYDLNSYISGMICHYVLDSIMHPYIYYKTGYFNKNRPSTYKYNNIHHFMEVFIDNDMVRRRTNGNPYKFPIGDFCFDLDHRFSTKLKKAIDYSFLKTYSIKNMNEIYFKSLKQMKRDIMLFRRDPYGIKKGIYKFIDTFTPKSCFRFEAVSYHYPLEDRHNFLNNEHKLWRNPCIYDMTSTESFVDLYLKAIKQAKVLICASFDYINGKDIELDKIFTNLSYLTGLNCSEKKELKYFEF